MIIDLTCLCIAILFTILGYIVGAARQIARIAAMIAGYFAALAAEPMVLGFVRGEIEAKGQAASIVVFSLLWLLFYVLFRILFTFLINLFPPPPKWLGQINQLLGALLGLLKTAIVIVIAALLFGMVKDPLLNVWPQALDLYNESKVVEYLCTTELSSRIIPQRAHRLVDLLKSSWDGRGVVRKPDKRIMDKPNFKQAEQDPSVKSALQRGDIGEALKADSFRKLLEDNEIARWLDEAPGSGK